MLNESIWKWQFHLIHLLVFLPDTFQLNTLIAQFTSENLFDLKINTKRNESLNYWNRVHPDNENQSDSRTETIDSITQPIKCPGQNNEIVTCSLWCSRLPDKFIRLTAFHCELTTTQNINLNGFCLRRTTDFDNFFYKINSFPLVCACFYLNTAFGCQLMQTTWNHHAVLGKFKPTFFRVVLFIKASAFKNHSGKNKRRRIETFPTQRPFQEFL